MELVREIRVQSKRADGTAGEGTPRWIGYVIAVIAIEHFRAPCEALELIVAQGLVAYNPVYSPKAALAFGEGVAGYCRKGRIHTAGVCPLRIRTRIPQD